MGHRVSREPPQRGQSPQICRRQLANLAAFGIWQWGREDISNGAPRYQLGIWVDAAALPKLENTGGGWLLGKRHPGLGHGGYEPPAGCSEGMSRRYRMPRSGLALEMGGQVGAAGLEAKREHT